MLAWRGAFRSARGGRSFSTGAGATLVEPAASSSGASAKVKNPLGKDYQELVFRGRGSYKLALGDLRQLLQKCTTKDDVKYGAQMVELFQRKGQDFSEEVNSHFVAMCIRAGQPELAVKHFSKYNNRIGSWTTPKSFLSLATAAIQASAAAKDKQVATVKDLATALDVITLKGVRVTPDSIKLLLQHCGAEPQVHAQLSTVAARVLGADEGAKLVAQHPAPVPEAAAPAAEAVAPAAAPAAAEAVDTK